MADPAPMLPKTGGAGEMAISDLNANKQIKVASFSTSNSSIEELKDFFVRYGVQPLEAPHESEPDGAAGKQQVKMSNFKENTFLGMQLYSRNETSSTYADLEDVGLAVTQWPPADKGGYTCSFEFKLTHPSGIQDSVTHNRDGLIKDIPAVASSSGTQNYIESSSIPGTGGTTVRITAASTSAPVVLTGTGGTKASFSGSIEIGFDSQGGIPTLPSGTSNFNASIVAVTLQGTGYYPSGTITADGVTSVDGLAADNDAVVIDGDGSQIPEVGSTITLSGGSVLLFAKRDIFLAPGATGDEINGKKIIGDGVKTIRQLVIEGNAEFNLVTDDLGLDSARPLDGKSTVSSADSRNAGTVAPNAPRDDDILKAGEEIEFTGGTPGLTISQLADKYNASTTRTTVLTVHEGGSASPSSGAKILISGGRGAGVRAANTGANSAFANFGRGDTVWSGLAIKGAYVTNTITKTKASREYTLQLTAILPDSDEANPAASTFGISLVPGFTTSSYYVDGPDSGGDGLPIRRTLKFPRRNSSGKITSQSGDLTRSQGRDFDWSNRFVIMSGPEHPQGDTYGDTEQNSQHYNR